MTRRTLNQRVGISVLWSLFTRLSGQLLSIINVIIIARLLGPERVGLFEKAAVVLGLLDVLTAIGLEAYLIQRRDVTRAIYDTTWTLNIFRGLLTGGLLLCFAPFADVALNAPGVKPLMLAIALQPIIDGFVNIGMVEYRRELKFGKIFQLQFARRLGSIGICLLIALISPSPWALVAGSVGGTIVGTALSYAISRYRPRLTLAAWREVIGFAKWMFTIETLGGISGRMEQLILGRAALPSELAFYNKADDLAALPSTEIAGPVTNALYPGIAAASEDPEKRRVLFRRFVGLGLAVSLPASAGVALAAPVLVSLLLGPQWLGVTVLLQILAVRGVTRFVAQYTQIALLAFGKVRFLGWLTVFYLVVRAASLPLGWVWHGLTGLAWGSFAAAMINASVNVGLLARMGELDLRQLSRECHRLVLGTIAMAAVLLTLAPQLTHWPLAAQLGAIAAIGAATFAVTVFGLWRMAGRPDGPEAILITNLVQPALRRIGRAA